MATTEAEAPRPSGAELKEPDTFKNVRMSLGLLADPKEFRSHIDLKNEPVEVWVAQLRMMYKIRLAEERIGDAVTKGLIGCPCHLGIGQEAIAVGVAQALRATDRVFGTHRSHTQYLALGGSVEALFAEVLGRATGCAQGFGGSMHLVSLDHGFKGSVPIVAGTVPLAVGAGLAALLDQKKSGRAEADVGVAFFGDGATEEGSVHESMNFAAQFGLPVLFVCENNLFSSHLHIRLRQPANSVARFAEANQLATRVVDGNDVAVVTQAARELLKRARSLGGPGFLEAVTYRWRGHVGPREDVDVGLKRHDELKEWRERDPIARLYQTLIISGQWTEADWAQLKAQVLAEINQAWDQALAAPPAVADQLLKPVWSKGNA